MISETSCMLEAHIWCIPLGRKDYSKSAIEKTEGVGEWKHIIIARYKNRGKINSVTTANNCFCNIWKEVNFTEVCPDCNFNFFFYWTFIHAQTSFGYIGMTWVSK